MFTAAATRAMKEGLLSRVFSGSTGTAKLSIYSGATLLGSYSLDSGLSSYNASDGLVHLVPSPGAINFVATGTATEAALVARDATILADDIPVQAGTAAVAGCAVMTSLDVALGGASELASLTIGG